MVMIMIAMMMLLVDNDYNDYGDADVIVRDDKEKTWLFGVSM